MTSQNQISDRGWNPREQIFLDKTTIYFGAQINTNTAYFQLAAKMEI